MLTSSRHVSPASLAFPVLTIGILAGCIDATKPTDQGDGSNPNGAPVDFESGDPLDYFIVYDGSIFAGADQRILEAGTELEPIVVTESRFIESGTKTSAHGSKSVVILDFKASSLLESAEIGISISEWMDQSFKLDFTPDGLEFSSEAPVDLYFFPHVLDPEHQNDWKAYSLYFEAEPGRFLLLQSTHSIKDWVNPETLQVTEEYCISANLNHFSKYAVLR